MINKELLSEVLGVFAYEVDFIQNNNVYYKFTTIEGSGDYSVDNINIYELAHKCKEWARGKGYSVTTGNRLDGTKKYDVLCIHMDEDIENSNATYFNEVVDSEPEAIFQACQWILDNK